MVAQNLDHTPSTAQAQDDTKRLHGSPESSNIEKETCTFVGVSKVDKIHTGVEKVITFFKCLIFMKLTHMTNRSSSFPAFCLHKGTVLLGLDTKTT